MGACASVSKAMRGEAMAKPPPEPKDDTPVPSNAMEVVEAKAEEEKAMEVAEAKAEEEKVVAEGNDKTLGTLMVQEEAPEEPEGSSQATTAPGNEIVEEEESRPEPLPVPEPAAAVASEAEEKSTKATA